jgi:glutamyl-tRNA synthetase
MQRMPLDEKVAMVLPYLVRAGLIAAPVSNEVKTEVAAIVQAAGDRIKTAGDIVGYNDFFVADEQLSYDEKAFDKAFGKPGAVEVLSRFYDRLAAAEAFDPASLEALLHAFVEPEGIKIGEIIHPVRVAATGKMVGFGLFDTLAILGKQRSLARITRALERAKDKGVGA